MSTDKRVAAIAGTIAVLSYADRMLTDAILSGLATDELHSAIGNVRGAIEKIKANAAKDGIYL